MKRINYKAAAKRGKHIFIPKKDAEEVLALLRGGEVKQGNGALFDGKGYCCLGVMQACKSGGKVEVHTMPKEYDLDYEIGENSRGFPTEKWLNSVGWKFTDSAGNVSNNPYLPEFFTSAADANDKGVTFAEIADAMEAAIQFTD